MENSVSYLSMTYGFMGVTIHKCEKTANQFQVGDFGWGELTQGFQVLVLSPKEYLGDRYQHHMISEWMCAWGIGCHTAF